jgi:hypothetical protein
VEATVAEAADMAAAATVVVDTLAEGMSAEGMSAVERSITVVVAARSIMVAGS